MSSIEFLTPKTPTYAGSTHEWYRKVRVNGVVYWVSVKITKRVRIPFKPRGQNIGYHYAGFVGTDIGGIWHGRVIGSIGAKGLLKKAGVLS